jgi:hypothetical protein
MTAVLHTTWVLIWGWHWFAMLWAAILETLLGEVFNRVLPPGRDHLVLYL